MKSFLKKLSVYFFGLVAFSSVLYGFSIDTSINNALQIIQRILVTTSGTNTGTVVLDINTGANKIYVNPSFLSDSTPYSGQYVLTLDADGNIAFTSGAVGATGPQGPTGATGATGPAGSSMSVGDPFMMGPATSIMFQGGGVSVSNIGTARTVTIPGGGSSTTPALSLSGNQLTISGGNTVDLGSLGFWSLVGNAATDPLINFLGTTDNQDLVFRTNNTERVRILGTSGYVGIGVQNPVYPLETSGGVYFHENETSFFVGNDASNIANGGPLPGVFLGVDATASSGSSTSLILYDTRGFGTSEPGLGIQISTMTGVGVIGSEAEANIGSKNGEYLDLKVEGGFDFSAYNQGNGNGVVTSHNKADIEMNNDVITLSVGTGIVRTVAGGSVVSTDSTYNSNIEIYSHYIKMYSSGGFADMYFDGVIGIFGFGTNNPGNTLDIARAYIPGTAGLRFSHRAGPNAGQILGLDANGDVVMLGNIGSFGSPSSPNYLKLGELDYTQLNSHSSVTALIPLNLSNQLPANSLITRVFMEVEPFFGAGGYRVDDFFLIASGTDIGSFNPSDGIIYGPGISTPFGGYNTYVFNFVPAAVPNPINDDYSIYVRYSDNAVHNDWMSGNVSFVVEYQTMPIALPF